MVAAERVAATVAQGVHGRRRVGQGDSFWQFRPFVAGDTMTRIDWRQSAKSDRSFVRETEWEAAQTVCLWRDGSASMRWRSEPGLPEKREQADLLLLALAALLLRGGERVIMVEPGARPVWGGAGLERLAAMLEQGAAAESDVTASGLPPAIDLPRQARLVLFGDFLSPLEQIHAAIGRLAAIPVSGHVLQVLDPAEALLPYTGRVRFFGLRREVDTLLPRVESVRDKYTKRLAAHQQGLAAICSAAGFTFGVHQTDAGPETALLGLYTALAPNEVR
ncbi:MAG: DUF58 domain-containing protein [Geminicoccaceae bacterium]